MELDKRVINYFSNLAYAEVDKSDLSFSQKRMLVFAVCRFSRIFFTATEAELAPILKKYNLDCPIEELPQLMNMYLMIYNILRIASDELKTASFFMFFYILLLESPHDEELFESICKILHTDSVLEKVLCSRYSESLPADENELFDSPDLSATFLRPFFDYRLLMTPSGRNKITQHVLNLLAKGEFNAVFEITEKLFSVFPDNEELIVANFASRISLCSATDEDSRNALLKDTLTLIDDCLPSAEKKRIFFVYYRGLALMGLKDLKNAEDSFRECLAMNPAFEPAILMLKALETNLS